MCLQDYLAELPMGGSDRVFAGAIALTFYITTIKLWGKLRAIRDKFRGNSKDK
ncbi:hypothetical protein [Nostoc flagelliforme]|nr:hypothetical protein [Nostoc flagelliforme]